VKLRGSDREAFGVATATFALMGMLFAFIALIVAGQAWSRSNDAKAQIIKLANGGILGNKVTVALQEFTLTPSPAEVKAGTVKIEADNNGSITHEVVIVRAPSIAALPKTVTATPERSVGSIREDAIAASDKMGETGEIAVGAKKTLSVKLTPGTYVMFCNIDTPAADGAVVNHFQHGMSAALVVK
jgi:uncharacterized cupredoxin-like copper-binding protein